MLSHVPERGNGVDEFPPSFGLGEEAHGSQVFLAPGNSLASALGGHNCPLSTRAGLAPKKNTAS